MMKTLYILRHAKSSWKDTSLRDHDRPLKKRGLRDAPRLGKLLQKKGMIPELIVSSTAVRALQTAEMVADNCGYDGEFIMTRRLYHASAEQHCAVGQETDEAITRLMLVGHNPGMEELVYRLSGEHVRMPTSALAEINLPIDSWQDLTLGVDGELVSLWWPKKHN